MIRMPNPTALQMMRRKAQAADIKIIENVLINQRGSSKWKFILNCLNYFYQSIDLNLIQELPVPC